jgi:transcriptional regulator of heat shock response
MKDRTFELLKLIIKEYVETAIPVGSKKLIEKYKLK